MASDRERPGGARAWQLQPSLVHINHGSFGACPRPVLEAQASWRARIEADPTGFFRHDLWPRLDEAREALAAFVGAPAEDLVFVPNATTGVNTVLRSLDLGTGDELLTTDHAYGSCRQALEHVAARTGARVVVAEVPFPLASSGQVVEAVLARVTPRTRLALVDHVTSPTALIFPVESLVGLLAEHGVDTLVDGAHAPGMLDLDITRIGAAYYTGNCHKWLCAPRGSAFLHVRPERQHRISPLVVGEGRPRGSAVTSAFRRAFDWPGTFDPSAWLSVPDAIRWVGAQASGGWPAVWARNRALALDGRARIGRALGAPLPAPEEMIGSMAALPLPAPPAGGPRRPATAEELRDRLRAGHRIVVPVIPWPRDPGRLVRVSAHLYNRPQDYAELAEALRAELAWERSGPALR